MMDFSDVRTVAFVIDASIVLLFALMWLGIVVFLRLKKKKSLVYLIFFTIFFAYIFKVLDYTQFQFQSLLILNYIMPGALLLRGATTGESVNFMPLITLTPGDVKTSLLNILLLIPFGFGLPFITTVRLKNILVIGMLFSIALECLQLITGLIAEMTFRIVDINDVLFNTTGVAIGYIAFIVCVRICRHISRDRRISTNPIVRHIAERPQVDSF